MFFQSRHRCLWYILSSFILSKFRRQPLSNQLLRPGPNRVCTHAVQIAFLVIISCSFYIHVQKTGNAFEASSAVESLSTRSLSAEYSLWLMEPRSQQIRSPHTFCPQRTRITSGKNCRSHFSKWILGFMPACKTHREKRPFHRIKEEREMSVTQIFCQIWN